MMTLIGNGSSDDLFGAAIGHSGKCFDGGDTVDRGVDAKKVKNSRHRQFAVFHASQPAESNDSDLGVLVIQPRSDYPEGSEVFPADMAQGGQSSIQKVFWICRNFSSSRCRPSICPTRCQLNDRSNQRYQWLPI